MTVLIPTHDHAQTLYDSVGTLLDQTFQDFEVFIVGDGVDDRTRAVVEDLQRRDSRLRFFDYPKGDQRGEANRHEALKHATSDFVCYLSDDDLWFPDHLETLMNLLEAVDFAHTLPVKVLTDGRFSVYLCDLSIRHYRRWMAGGRNLLPMACVGHRLDTYRRLPRGWVTEPNVFTSVVLWRQFVELADCRFASGMMPTMLHLASTTRKVAGQAWFDELHEWRERVADSHWRQSFLQTLFDQQMRDHCRVEAKIRGLREKAGNEAGKAVGESPAPC